MHCFNSIHSPYNEQNTLASLISCKSFFNMATDSNFCHHAAGECRRQVKNVTHFVKNVKIVEFRDHIWNHHEEYIEISTNMPGIGSVISELAVTI